MAVLAQMAHKPVISTHHGDLILPPGLFNRFVRWFTFQNYRMIRITSYNVCYTKLLR